MKDYTFKISRHKPLSQSVAIIKINKHDNTCYMDHSPMDITAVMIIRAVVFEKSSYIALQIILIEQSLNTNQIECVSEAITFM